MRLHPRLSQLTVQSVKALVYEFACRCRSGMVALDSLAKTVSSQVSVDILCAFFWSFYFWHGASFFFLPFNWCANCLHVDSLVIAVSWMDAKIHPWLPSDYLAAVTSSAVFRRYSRFKETHDMPPELQSVSCTQREEQSGSELSVAASCQCSGW